MSIFGEHLRTLIDSNKINIYSFAKSVGLERTAMHKIMSGGRIPSQEYATKLIDALPLSPSERQNLLESYNISKIGEFRYRQRTQVKNLIESIAYIENGIKTSNNSSAASIPTLSETNFAATGHFAVNNLVKGVIEEAAENKNCQELDFVIPENYQFFYNELLAAYLLCPSLRIRHIIAFTKKVDFPESSNSNLTLLSHVLPFAFAPGFAYFPYYYFRNSPDTELTQSMPYFILTSSKKLVLIDSDFSKAALICDSDIVELYRNNYTVMLQQGKPLIKRFDSVFEVLGHYRSINHHADAPTHWVEPEPCIGPLVTDEIINKYIKHDLPHRAELITMVCMHYGILRENQLRNLNICTTNGLSQMVRTGYIYNAPSELMNPISRETMKELLITLRNRIEGKKVKVLFTNPSKFVLPSKTLLSVNRITGLNFIMHSSGTDLRAFFLSEDSINEAFVDFVESLEDAGLVYNENESLNALDKAINEMFS